MKKILVTLTSVGVFLASPLTALAEAQPTISINMPGSYSSLSTLTVSSVVTGAVNLLLILAALLFFFMLVVGGIQWIVSGGDKTGSENARKKITSALVGLVIVFSAWAIVKLIGALFGIEILNFTIPQLIPTPII
ncbi:hypothetical protein COS54_00790 [Candidatus Shapirobacteria bacterium CG03_land_8_20_14_0_80_39_12]|uniref:Uncharacterized protein n=1 Tax=Candidatus Shapirobacteria bacterium CG03_land_8_20_14_0_80_39_12 TaxID=1974879 RepID=A0A2M7BEM6_9BACT|nr:MAG: hypothetical protein COS54_00790 [Candidatus Shapirobacteria bacterium CG03_land_8_20_14_0_80_39_12]